MIIVCGYVKPTGLTSRQNGYVGGIMVKKMIKLAEEQLTNGAVSQFANTTTSQA